ncbi:MAG: SDR family oxidoreductase [Betaproteobacteria bacterium]|nr:SDR family oxidoreductase [Betaproteobacteria bacterium]
MLRVLIIGCGDIALRLVRQQREPSSSRHGGVQFYALNRSPSRIPLLREMGIRPIEGDLDDRRSLVRLAGIADVVMHFAPPQSDALVDRRTRRLLAALAMGAAPARMVYISTTGVYGDCAGAWVEETRPARPGNARARRRWDAERQLRGWAIRAGVRLSILRAPGIYARGRLPEARVRQGLPALLPAVDIHTNHIHAEDLARLAWRAAFRARPQRLYNAVDDSGLRMGDWFDCVADHLGVPRPPRLPYEAVMSAVTPAMRTFLNESRRLSNRRIREELGFRFCYPDVHVGLFGD